MLRETTKADYKYCLTELCEKLGTRKYQSVTSKVAKHNIAGASVPIALDDAVKNGEIKKGDTIVLTAIGSGWTWGSTILKWVK
jgi:3-oxoacyl-[acyl-carrier-protein] synthase-3